MERSQVAPRISSLRAVRPDEAARMLCETSVKAVDILMRRLDMARASVFEGEGKTAFLQGACAR